jgi:hypothetical protein
MTRSNAANTHGTVFRVLILALFILSATSISHAGQASYDMPSTVDRSANYLFFLHNYFVEMKGPDGACKYYDILQAFAEKDFTVISEVRSGQIVPAEYAKKITGQVTRLLGAGVPPENITVAGHSKGGVITLCVASQLGNPKVRFVVMAGCEIKPLAQTYPDFTMLSGDFLSVYASSDSVAGSCETAFSKSVQGISSREIELESAKGHRLFFQPEDLWLEPVMTWIRQKH